MASIIDLSLLQNFQLIFTWLFVFATVYAILQFAKIAGDNKGLHSLMAFSIAMLAAVSGSIMKVVNGMIPWFILVIVFGMFMLMITRFLGFGDLSVAQMLGGDKMTPWWIFFIGIAILISALGGVYGQSTLELTTGQQNVTGTDYSGTPPTDGSTQQTGSTFNKQLTDALFHPKVLAFISLILIASFTLRMMSGSGM